MLLYICVRRYIRSGTNRFPSYMSGEYSSMEGGYWTSEPTPSAEFSIGNKVQHLVSPLFVFSPSYCVE